MKRIFLMGILLATIGCVQQQAGSEGDGRSPSDASSENLEESLSVPEDETAAIGVFQSQALASLPENLAPEMKAWVIGKINDREHLHARRAIYETCFERIDGTLTEYERDSLILHGTTDDLRGDRSGDCWVITSVGREDSKMPSDSSIEGYLNAQTGELLVLWICPEG